MSIGNEEQEPYKKWLYNKFFIENKRHAAISISGGVDSALAYYLTCEYVRDNQIEDFSIIPFHGWDTARTNDYSPTAAKYVASYMKNIFTGLNIKDLYIYAFKCELTESKNKYSEPVKRLFETEKYCDENFFINGQIKKPDFFPSPPGAQPRYGKFFESRFLLSSYDKKWVAQKYIEKNLKDLFPHTVSCGSNVSAPCKKCWWCVEKYWAFRAFDGEPIGPIG